MKKFFIKIFFSFLIISTFFMVGGFCFAELLPKEVLALDAYPSVNRDAVNSDEDSCVLDEGKNDKEMGDMAESDIPQNHSLLPCCVGNFNHNENKVSVNSGFYFFSSLALHLPVFDLFLSSIETHLFFYNSLIIPPPEIAKIKSTVIRI
jgi:hypothetical protein